MTYSVDGRTPTPLRPGWGSMVMIVSGLLWLSPALAWDAPSLDTEARLTFAREMADKSPALAADALALGLGAGDAKARAQIAKACAEPQLEEVCARASVRAYLEAFEPNAPKASPKKAGSSAAGASKPTRRTGRRTKPGTSKAGKPKGSKPKAGKPKAGKSRRSRSRKRSKNLFATPDKAK